MTEQKVSFRYAKAVIESAVKEKLTEILLHDFEIVKEVLLKSRDLKVFLKNPVITDNQKKKVINEIFKGKVNSSTLNFLIFLVTKGRAEIIIDIIAQYEVQYNQMNNRIKAEITSAIALNDEMKTKLVQKITDYTKKTVLPEFKVQDSIKGGIIVQIEDWVYDASLKCQLENLYLSLAKK